MKSAELPKDEVNRLKALLDYRVLDTEAESAYDDLTQIASQICQAPIALVSLIDKDRQWFKSRVGLDAPETHRDLAFCAHAILQDTIFEVADASKDARFSDNPLVSQDPSIRFYAGTPLITPDGYALGTLCVIDREPKVLDDGQKVALAALGRQVVSLLELRLNTERLERANRIRDRLLVMLSHDLKSSFHTMIGYSAAIEKRIDVFSKQEIIDSVARIQKIGARAHQQLLAMLEWAKAQVEQQKSPPDHLDTNEVCLEAIDLVSDMAANKGMTITFDLDADIDSIWASRCLLVSALQNLLSNAIKFSARDTVIVLQVKQSQAAFTFSVSDKGTGMSEDILEKVFLGDGGYSGVGTLGETGTGLGTLLIRDFVASAGGDINVSSEEGVGSTISFTLPKRVLA